MTTKIMTISDMQDYILNNTLNCYNKLSKNFFKRKYWEYATAIMDEFSGCTIEKNGIEFYINGNKLVYSIS